MGLPKRLHAYHRSFSLVALAVVVALFGFQQIRVSVDVVPTTESVQQEAPVWLSNNRPSDKVRVHEDTPSHPLTPKVAKPMDIQDSTATGLPSSPAIQRNNSMIEHPVLLFRSGLSSILPSSIPVVLWPYMDAAAKKKDQTTSADVVHIEVNGVEESSVLTLANESVRTLHPNVVWVTDAKFPYSQWCTRLAEKARKIQDMRRTKSLPLVWPVYVVDFTDPPQLPQHCKALEEVLGSAHVLYFKRSIVTDRSWNFTANWLHLGHALPSTPETTFEQTPLIVRTDIVESIVGYLAEDDNDGNNNISIANLPNRPRHVDVAHYWPPSTDVAQFSNLRNRVSTWLLDNLGKEYQVYCDMIGQHDRVGRRQAQKGYVEAMANTKIIVVAQRDTYEDHYRLWEALVSGALVVSDPMLTLPKSLQNGTHLLVYHSLEQLILFVRFYLEHPAERLAVALEGYKAAMSSHRSWHRMEEIILGRPVTTCETSISKTAPRCPFTAHTSEWR